MLLGLGVVPVGLTPAGAPAGWGARPKAAPSGDLAAPAGASRPAGRRHARHRASGTVAFSVGGLRTPFSVSLLRVRSQ